MPAIIDSGAAYIAAKTGASEPVEITDFVLANIAGLDETQPVDLAETMPDAGDIVYQAPVSQGGYLSPDKIVYSLSMDTSVGDFTFNWLGLKASDGTLVAVAYLPETVKTANSGGVQGNNITRNFLLQFADAQLATGVSVPAETWQIDLSAFLEAMDERERASNRTLYGRAAFFADGWKLVDNAGSYELQPGVGYVEGVGIVATDPVPVTEGALPTDISLDVTLEKGVDAVTAVAAPVRGAPADYTDSSGRAHYCEVVAHIDSGGVVEDLRPTYAVTDGVLQFLLGKIGEQVPQSQVATTEQKGVVELANPTEAVEGTDTERALTPNGLAYAVVNALGSTSTTRPLSASRGKYLHDMLIKDPSTTERALLELATYAEVQAGADHQRAVTSAGLASAVIDSLTSTSTSRPLSAAQGRALNLKTRDATTDRKGVVELATSTETVDGSDNARAVPPNALLAALNARLGIGRPTDLAKDFLAKATAAEMRNILGLGAAATRWPTFAEVTDKPAVYPPAGHTHAAGDIVSGVLAVARVPNMPASKITSGTLGTARIPDLPASKITSGIFQPARIPGLPASKINSGILPVSRGGTGVNSLAALAQQLEEYLMRQDWSVCDRGDAVRPAGGAGVKHICTGFTATITTTGEEVLELYDGGTSGELLWRGEITANNTDDIGTLVVTGLALAGSPNTAMTLICSGSLARLVLMGYDTTA